MTFFVQGNSTCLAYAPTHRYQVHHTRENNVCLFNFTNDFSYSFKIFINLIINLILIR